MNDSMFTFLIRVGNRIDSLMAFQVDLNKKSRHSLCCVNLTYKHQAFRC